MHLASNSSLVGFVASRASVMASRRSVAMEKDAVREGMKSNRGRSADGRNGARHRESPPNCGPYLPLSLHNRW